MTTVSAGTGLQSTAGDRSHVHVEAGTGPSEKVATYSSPFRRREVKRKPQCCVLSFRTTMKTTFLPPLSGCQQVENERSPGTFAEPSMEDFYGGAA